MDTEKTDVDTIETNDSSVEESEKEQPVLKSQIEDSSHHSESEDKERKSTISRIADILRGKRTEQSEAPASHTEDKPTDEKPTEDAVGEPESEDVEGDSPDETVGAEKEDYTEIDPRFVATARQYGWSDDRIIEYAEGHDDRDVVMLTSMMEGKAQDVKTEDVVTVPEKDESPYAKVLQELETNEAVGDLTKQLLRSLVNDLKETKASLKDMGAVQKEAASTRRQQEWVGRLQVADEFFDETAKEFPELGTSKTLKRMPDGTLNPNDAAVKSRESLFKMAAVLFDSGSNWHSAVKDAIRWYKGGRDDAVEAKVLRKIKDNAKRISPKRETRHVTRKFSSDTEEKAAVVNAALRKHGVELPE